LQDSACSPAPVKDAAATYRLRIEQRNHWDDAAASVGDDTLGPLTGGGSVKPSLGND